jgi:hypothetical protein
VEVQGFAHGRFDLVRECFAGILAAQPGTGAAFAAWCDGSLVVDLWGGYADAGRRRRWEAGSVVQPYSVSKPFAAVCAGSPALSDPAMAAGGYGQGSSPARYTSTRPAKSEDEKAH